MGKCIAYVAAAIVFMGLGALVAGACVYYLVPRESQKLVTIVPGRFAECVFKGNVSGKISFQQSHSGSNKSLVITGEINGKDVKSGSHGFHIHEWGVPQDGDCKGCGGHYNPEGMKHGAPNNSQRHVGDLGNIDFNETSAVIEMEDHMATLWGDKSIVGRALVLHEGEDDLGTKEEDAGSIKTGNAGSRLACCTIYLVAA